MDTNTTFTITVIGASQGTGATLVDHALTAGHHVRSVSRRTPPADGRLHHRTIRGDATDPAILREAVAGADAVVVMVGSPANSREPIRTDVTTAVVEAMRAEGVRRLVVQSSLGVGDSIRRLGPFTRYLVFPFVLKHPMRDHHTQENVVRASGLDWTILRPGYLSDRPATGRLRAIPTSYAGRFAPRATRADVAELSLAIVGDRSTIGRELMLVTPSAAVTPAEPVEATF